MSTNYIEEFNNTYNEVFDSDGNIKACGREKCKKLIWLANRITEMGADFGDSTTGIMRADELRNLHSKLN